MKLKDKTVVVTGGARGTTRPTLTKPLNCLTNGDYPRLGCSS